MEFIGDGEHWQSPKFLQMVEEKARLERKYSWRRFSLATVCGCPVLWAGRRTISGWLAGRDQGLEPDRITVCRLWAITGFK
jgi:hypothetical protein